MTDGLRDRARTVGRPGRGPTRTPVWRVETARLAVRAWEPVDTPAWEAAVEGSRDHLRPWLPWASAVGGRTSRVPAVGAWPAGAPEAALGLFEPGGGAVVGGAGLHRTLGLDGCTVSYWLATPYLGRGYATEVAAALTRIAFEHHGVGRVEIHVDAENVRSAAVADRLGFRLVGTRRRLVDTGERRLVERPIEIHRLTRVTYPGSPSAASPLSAFDRQGARLLPA